MMVLGVDWGHKRVGLALGDTETRVASPWKTIVARANLSREIAHLAAREGAGAIVIGYPKTLKGEAAHMAHQIDEFAADLRDLTEVQIVLEDERLSSRLADRQRAEGSRADRDSLAAAAILAAWLERLPASPAGRQGSAN